MVYEDDQDVQSKGNFEVEEGRLEFEAVWGTGDNVKNFDLSFSLQGDKLIVNVLTNEHNEPLPLPANSWTFKRLENDPNSLQGAWITYSAQNEIPEELPAKFTSNKHQMYLFIKDTLYSITGLGFTEMPYLAEDNLTYTLVKAGTEFGPFYPVENYAGTILQMATDDENASFLLHGSYFKRVLSRKELATTFKPMQSRIPNNTSWRLVEDSAGHFDDAVLNVLVDTVYRLSVYSEDENCESGSNSGWLNYEDDMGLTVFIISNINNLSCGFFEANEARQYMISELSDTNLVLMDASTARKLTFSKILNDKKLGAWATTMSNFLNLLPDGKYFFTKGYNANISVEYGTYRFSGNTFVATSSIFDGDDESGFADDGVIKPAQSYIYDEEDNTMSISDWKFGRIDQVDFR